MSFMSLNADLTHWGRETHICVGNLTIIGSDNGLSPGRRRAIIWNNAGILLIGPLRTNFSEISIEVHIFSFKKMYLKMSSGNWQPSCPGLNVLINKDSQSHHTLLLTPQADHPPMWLTQVDWSLHLVYTDYNWFRGFHGSSSTELHQSIKNLSLPPYTTDSGFPQKFEKKVPWLFQAKFQISRQQKYQYLFLPPMYQIVESITDRHEAHSYTDTRMIWSRPTDYWTDFTSNSTDSIQEVTITLVNLIKKGNRFSY